MVARLDGLKLRFATMEKFAGFWSQFGSGKGGREIMKMENERRGNEDQQHKGSKESGMLVNVMTISHDEGKQCLVDQYDQCNLCNCARGNLDHCC